MVHSGSELTPAKFGLIYVHGEAMLGTRTHIPQDPVSEDRFRSKCLDTLGAAGILCCRGVKAGLVVNPGSGTS